MGRGSREERLERLLAGQSYLEGEVQDLVAKHGKRKTETQLKALVRNDTLMRSLERLFEEHPWPAAEEVRVARSFKKKGKKAKKAGHKRILNLMLSDLHYGSDIGIEETGTQYGPVEESRRTAAVVAEVAKWKRQYRDETVLYVHLLGDIIEGKLHDPESAAPMTEQVYRAWWVLGQALRFLSTQFQQVKVFCTPGNHGRRKDRHPGRAVNQKWDSIETMIYGGLKLALADHKNVKFEIPLTPYYRYKAFDKTGFMTHGDTVLNVGYPNRAINVEGIRRQINEINAKEHCDLFGAGHVHVASTVRLPNGPMLITNGCLVPSGEYGQSIGIMHTGCCQQIWESVPGIICGHRMEIIVNESNDKDASLDKIISPYPGMQAFGQL